MKRALRKILALLPWRKPSAINDVLLSTNPWTMSLKERVEMTCACRDTDPIPKVPNAGALVESENGKLQVMHNGLRLVYGGYHGDWMAEIITNLKGHHEPQEEKAFYEVLQVLKATPQKQYSIIELGCFWSYYSLWFLKELANAKAFCFEPDPLNMEIGKKNAEINGLHPVFERAAAGSKDGDIVRLTLDSNPTKAVDVKVRSVDSIAREKQLEQIDILHMDVQGAELEALKGAVQSIREHKIRFLFVSTHHYCLSKDVLTHQKCVQFIQEKGGKILASHNVLESFSGDGLIVASFWESDKDLEVRTSNNSSDRSLFRSYEKDLQLLVNFIEAR